ncbi:UDP-N-acetylglucosamine transporter yea4 [Yarrowia sp. C11]|nr:UDP-N-acetylglucosamine transporter yea4 [Yarrowia sp. C11]KAG5370813.1 UDP-N-acetylglucosamine transporter yea4 [Yarrowia sp. E02]
MDRKSQVTQRGGAEKAEADHVTSRESDPPRDSIIAASLSITATEWLGIGTLIFGGCCSNVFTLEAIVKDIPDSGSLITFVQFLFVSIEGLFHFVDFSRPAPFLKPSKAPFSRWAVSVLLFFLVSVINNYVWKLHISVPLHIIFRSGGTVITMIMGVIKGKRYTRGQVLSVAILTAGVILATFSQAPNKDSKGQKATTTQFVLGIVLLLVAAILSSFQGLFSEVTYSQYGGNWRESLFYTHFLALPLFAPLAKDIIRQFGSVWGAHPRLHLDVLGHNLTVSRAFMWLLLNATTQYLCIRGVNKLSGATSALTVGIVLNVRKFVSLLLSVLLFGNSLSSLTILGTVLLFAGAGLYSFEGTKAAEKVKAKKDK